MSEELRAKTTVLVVDDEEDLLFLIQQILEREGFDTKISPNGENMVDIITQTRPDIIMMDIHMRGIDGASICQLLKSNPSTAGILVVMFSANDNITKITRDCGADGFIRKPFDSQNFKETFQDISKKVANG
jgi:CheY-like chemotaxis protein